jgi:hypothetical protein
MLLTLSLFGGGVGAQNSPYRYDDDPTIYADAPADDLYARLKYIGLGDQDYLSLGADLRERVESSSLTTLGFRDRDADAYDLHRLQVFADLQIGADLRAFLQLGNEQEVGRAPAALPTDINRFDLAQGFVDLSHDVGDGRATLRLGRAEMSFDDGALISLRDGPNVRQVWDGARLSYIAGAWHLDAFAVDPVSVQPGVFVDHPIEGGSLQGVHLTVTPSAASALDAFYYHNRAPGVVFYGAAGEETTDTAGIRLRGNAQGVDGSLGAIGQIGSIAGRDVEAFALHGDVGYEIPGLAWSPHVTVRSDILSGGDPKAAHLGTFNALYPNYAYSTEATIEAPSNLEQVAGVFKVRPATSLSLQYTAEGLWRYSTRDAFYTAPGIPLVRPSAADNNRFSGIEQQLKAVWQLNQCVTLTSAYAHFSVGAFIRHGGGQDEDFGLFQVALRL